MADSRSEGRTPPERSLTRRRLLLATGGLGAAISGCDAAQRPREGFLGVMERWNERVQEALFAPNRLAPELPLTAVTPPEAFPHYFISPTVPAIPRGWTLRIGGEVKTPITLSLDELQALPKTRYRIRHYCVEGWSAVAEWEGVALRALAKRVGLSPSVRYVEFRSFDSGYWSSWDLPSALHPQTILAYGMNGDLLPPGHGAPLRLYSAVKLGYKMVKYLTEVNFLSRRTEGYWESRGYEWFAGV